MGHDLPSEIEEPEDLLCPITYALFRDPVIAGDGRTYELAGLTAFWKRRPLADFVGGPALSAADLKPAADVRAAVQAWLDEHPDLVPSGWPSRDPGRASTLEECITLSQAINQAAATRAAAEAAEAGNDAALLAHAAAELRGFAPTISFMGRTPRGRRAEFLGLYDRCEDLPLVAGRFAYRQRGGNQRLREERMLWYAANGFWHFGWRQNLGEQTGWFIVADTAPAPETIVAEWQLWDGGNLLQAPHVSIRAVAHHGNAEDDERVDHDVDTDDDDDRVDIDDEGRAGGDGVNHEIAEALAHAAPSVTLYMEHPEHRYARPEHQAWLGLYDRVQGAQDEPIILHGRYCYVLRRTNKVMWWSSGYWHLGLRQHLGAQTAVLIAGDAAHVPENIRSPWMHFKDGAWTPVPSCVRCIKGDTGPQPGAFWGLWQGVRIHVVAFIIVASQLDAFAAVEQGLPFRHLCMAMASLILLWIWLFSTSQERT